MKVDVKSHKKQTVGIGLLLGVLFISLNLRAPFTGVGTLIKPVSAYFNLSESAFGLLTTLPLLAFALISNITHPFTKKWGLGKVLLFAMLFLSLAIGIRSSGTIWGLYLGTAILGISIAFGNVLIPVVIKTKFPRRAGLITGLQTGLMSAGSMVAAGISVPLAVKMSSGWRGSMGVWIFLSVAAVLVWLPNVKKVGKPRESLRKLRGGKKLLSSRVGWFVTLYMGMQSFSSYIIFAWFPEIVTSMGFDPAYGGRMLALSQGAGIAGSLLFPIWAGRTKNQQFIVLILSVLEVVGFLGLVFWGPDFVPYSAVILGIVTGGAFALALLFIIYRTKDSDTAARLSGVSQSLGYLIAAVGPFIIGVIQEATQIWAYSLVFMAVMVLFKEFVGNGAAKNQQI